MSRYGYGPTPDPHITYQPDVVMIGGGPNVIRSASSDGLSWTLDGSAKGVADLQPGKVMFASARAAGRVLAVQHVGSDVKVVVAPVSLTDVIKDGHLTMDKPIDLGSMLYQQIPDEPGAYKDLKTVSSSPSTDSSTTPGDDGGTTPTDGSSTPTDTSSSGAADTPSPSSTDDSTDTSTPDTGAPTDSPSSGDAGATTTETGGTDASATDTATTDTATSAASATDAAAGTPLIKLPPLDLAAAVKAAGGTLPPPGPSFKSNPGETVTDTVGNFEISPYRDGKNLGFTATYTQGLKLTFDCSLDMSQATVHADVPISGGQVGPSAQMWINGIKALRVKLAAGSANGLGDNKKARIQLPVDLATAEIPIYGVPTVMSYKMTLIVDTGFSAKNSTLSASASIPLSGKAGFNGSQGLAPAGSSSGNGLLDTLTGTSLGINGVVVAANFRASWGLGFAGASAGPYANVTFSAGLTVGSDAGMLKCKSVTYKVTVGGGVGMAVSTDSVEAITESLDKVLGPAGQAILGKTITISASKDLATATVEDRTDYSPNVKGCSPQ